jgi:hypothetical protein
MQWIAWPEQVDLLVYRRETGDDQGRPPGLHDASVHQRYKQSPVSLNEEHGRVTRIFASRALQLDGAGNGKSNE